MPSLIRSNGLNCQRLEQITNSSSYYSFKNKIDIHFRDNIKYNIYLKLTKHTGMNANLVQNNTPGKTLICIIQQYIEYPEEIHI